MENIETFMRMSERLLAVGISGMCIYLGYKLFLSAPTQTNQQGEIELPGIKVVLSRVGPGIFFAAFGAAVLFTSFNSRVKTSQSTDGGTSDFLGAIQQPLDSTASPDTSGIIQRRTKVFNNIGLLNCLDKTMSADSKFQNMHRSLKITLSDSKHLWLKSVWDTETWGPASALDANGPTTNATTELKELYNYVDPTCPK